MKTFLILEKWFDRKFTMAFPVKAITPIFSPTPSCRTTAKKLGDFQMSRVLKRALLGNGLRLSLEGV